MNLVVNTHSPLWSTPTESSPSSGQHPLLPSVTVSLSLSQLYLVSVFLLYGFPALFFKHSDFLPRHPTRRAGLGFGEYQPHVLGGPQGVHHIVGMAWWQDMEGRGGMIGVG